MQANLLPLFPLQVVVFPRTQLPLHIFEERYKEMVGEAIRDHSEFGIVLVKEEGILNAGCTVVVDKVLKAHPDGRMDILTRGIRRFEIVMLNQEKPYLRGEVAYFDDDEPDPAPTDVRTEALRLYRSWMALEEKSPNEAVLSDAQLSFQLAQGIEDLDFLHFLLLTRSETTRPQRAEKKHPEQTIVSRSTRPDAARQTILAPGPELKLERELDAPNLLAFEMPKLPDPPPQPKLFMPPAPVERAEEQPTLEKSPELAASETPKVLEQMPKPPPRAFVPP